MSDEKKSKLEYYVVDTETTGWKPGWHEVTELSFIRCADKNELTRTIKAEHIKRASFKALKVTNRTWNDLRFGDPKDKVVNQVERFFKQDKKTARDRCMIAHNHSFDKRFLVALWNSCGKKFPAENWFDTLAMAKQWSRKMGKPQPSYKLKDVLAFTGIKGVPGAHDARSDARNTYFLWKRGMEEGLDHLACLKRYDLE